MEFGGLDSGGARGVHKNTFGVKSPAGTISKVPFKHTK
jgi:hypothetical protein